MTTAHVSRSSVVTTAHVSRSSVMTTAHVSRSSVMTTAHVSRRSVVTTAHVSRSSVMTTAHVSRRSVVTTAHVSRSSVMTTAHVSRSGTNNLGEEIALKQPARYQCPRPMESASNLPINKFRHSRLLFVFGAAAPQGASTFTFTRFLDHTQRRNTAGRTPLDE